MTHRRGNEFDAPEELTANQGAMMAVLSGTGSADTRLLRRVTNLNPEGLRAELSALESGGLIRRNRGSGLMFRFLTDARGESLYELTPAGRAHPEVRAVAAPRVRGSRAW